MFFLFFLLVINLKRGNFAAASLQKLGDDMVAANGTGIAGAL